MGISNRLLGVRFLSFFMLLLGINAVSNRVFAQTGVPEFYVHSSGPFYGSGYGFTSAFFNKSRCMYVYPAGVFKDSVNAGAGEGIITHLYVQVESINYLSSINTLKIWFGQDTITRLQKGQWYSGTLTEHHSNSMTFVGLNTGAWMKFTLDEPFTYDPKKSLIVSINNLGGHRKFEARHEGTPFISRSYGKSSAVGSDTLRPIIGFDIQPRTNYDVGIFSIDSTTSPCAGPTKVYATIANYGKKPISNFKVSWKFNGKLQKTISVNQALDTIGGKGDFKHQVYLGQADILSGEDLVVYSTDPNGNNDGYPKNDSLLNEYSPTLSGSYRVGYKGGVFDDLHEVSSALKRLPVCGGAKFYISRNSFNKELVFTDIKGLSRLSDSNCVEFISQHPDSVVLRFRSKSTMPVLALDSVKWFTFRNITINLRDTADGWGVLLTNETEHIDFKNCVIKLDSTKASRNEPLYGVVVAGSNTSVSTITNGVNHISFDSCKFIGGRANVMVTGTMDTLNFLKDWRFNHCLFIGAERNALMARDVDSLTIKNSTFDSMRYYPIRISLDLTNVANINILNNRVSGAVSLVNINPKSFYKGHRSTIANNVFSNSYQSRLLTFNLVRETDVSHNSFYGNNLRLLDADRVTRVNLLNNNFHYRGVGVCMRTSDFANWGECDYNNYYLQDSTASYWEYRLYKTGKIRRVQNIDSLQFYEPQLFSKKSHQHYWNQDPQFVDTIYFKPSSKYTPMYGPNIGVSTDITGASRCTLYTQIGPYESDSAFAISKANFNSRMDTLWQFGPMVFQSNSTSAVESKWYVNGQFVSDSVHLIYTPTRIGTDTIKLFIKNCGGTDSITKYFQVWRLLKAPIVNFYIDDTIIVAKQPFTLIDSTKYGPNKWYYEISDTLGNKLGFDKKLNKYVKLYEYVNGDSTSQFPELFFKWKGVYDIKLVAANARAKDSLVKRVTVQSGYDLPIASFKASDTVVNTNTTVRLNNTTLNNPTEWRFEVSDANGRKAIYDPSAATWVGTYYWVNLDSTSKNPSLWFNYPGYYTVKLVVSNPEGADSLVKTNYIKVSLAATVCDFDDSTNATFGTLYDSGGPKGKYTWSQSCDYTISSCKGNLELNLDDFDLGADDYLRIYEGTNTSGTPLWDAKSYPNGMEGSLVHSSVIRKWTVNSGSVYIQFVSDQSRATIGRGFALEWEFDTAGFQPAKADFQLQSIGCVNLPIELINTSKGGYSSFQWDVYNNGTNDANTKHHTTRFTKSGTYPVALIAYSHCWLPDTLVKSVSITQPSARPSPLFKADDTVSVAGSIVRLTATVDVCTDLNQWIISPNDYTLVKNNSLTNDTVSLIFNRPGLYSVALRQKNAVGEDTLVKVNYIRIYCEPSVGQKVSGLGVTRVVLADIDHESKAGIKTYTDYSAESTDLLRGRNYDVTLEQKASLTTHRRVWIDWNGDGRFNDSTELVVVHGPSNAARVTQTISVPLWANLGESRMRVAVGKSSFKTSCGFLSQGEYKDYSIFIQKRDTAKPTISLLGNTTDTIPVYTGWKEPGYLANDIHDGNITTSVIVAGRVDTARVGVYMISYKVTDIDNNTTSAIRRVVVEDTTAPEISLIGKDSVYIYLNETYVETGVMVNDNYYSGLEAVITGKVDTTRGGVYQLQYCVSDSSGNGPVCVNRWVFVQDTIPPTIQLLGASTISVEQCSEYEDAGYSASDNDTVVVAEAGTWKGNTDVRGTFSLKYVATDGSGNSVSVERLITVVDKTAPRLKLNGNPIDTVQRWKDYADPGVSITYECFDSLETRLIVKGTFKNTQSNGAYTLEYTAVDSSGNQSDKLIRLVVVEEQTGLQEVGPIKYAVYPNPSSGSLVIESWAEKAEKVYVAVFSSEGRKVFELPQTLLAKHRSLSLDLSHLETGMYFLSISSNKGDAISKLILAR